MNNHQDLPLKNDIAARFVPKIVALMVYLGTLCLIFTLFMMNSSRVWQDQFTTQLSIEIPTFQGTSSSALQTRVLHLLNKTPGIQKATPIPETEMTSLFSSLLGQEVDVKLLSLPTIIDVSFDGKEKVDTKTLEAHLKNISPDIQLVNHQDWQTQVLNLIQTSVIMALIVTFLILIAAIATTSFATHTSLLIHRQVIEVLSLIGATNSYIAKQFQMHALKQGLMASAIGSTFAFLTFLGISFLLEKAGFPFFMTTAFLIQAVCVFIIAPLLTAFAMMFSARWAVMKELRS